MPSQRLLIYSPLLHFATALILLHMSRVPFSGHSPWRSASSPFLPFPKAAACPTRWHRPSWRTASVSGYQSPPVPAWRADGEDPVLGRTVNAHILRRAVVRDFIIEGGKLRHFDEVAETLLLDHIVRHVKFKIRRLVNIAAQASKHLMSCRSSSFGRRYLNSRYNSVSELLIVVPERKVAPKSFPVRSCMVRMAKSMLSAFWLPSLFPNPRHTVVARVESQILELVALIYEDVVDAHLLKSTTSSVRDFMACSTFSSFASRLCFASQSFQHRPRHVLSCSCRSTSRFSSTVSSSACRMRCCNSRRLRYLAELVVRHDDAIVVVVLYIIE